jgi:hypothetical protein
MAFAAPDSFSGIGGVESAVAVETRSLGRRSSGTGISWRYIPHDLPPGGTVYYYAK